MTELQIGIVLFVQCVLIVTGAALYMLGGREGKWKRRFIAGPLQAGALVGGYYLFGIFNWLHVLLIPLFIIIYHLGYNRNKERFLNPRVYISAGIFVVSFGLMLYTQGVSSFRVLPIHLSFTLFTIYMGIFNPFHASAEEFLISLSFTFPLIFYGVLKII